MNVINKIDWPAWLACIVIVIGFREAAVWIMRYFNHPELGNLAGLLSLLAVLLLWRKFATLPSRVVDCNNRMLKESAFAFLPICVASLIMLSHMGRDISLFLLVLVVSTLLPLWLYAKLAKRFI